MKKEYMRGKNEQGLCAWANCNKTVDPEAVAGFGPCIIGYLCHDCATSFNKTIERHKAELVAEMDAIIFRDIVAARGNS